MLKFKKAGKTVFILRDEDDQPIEVDELILDESDIKPKKSKNKMEIQG